jgi:predicted transcriptional regulator
MTTTSLKLADDLSDWLEGLAAARRVSKSTVIREALQMYRQSVAEPESGSFFAAAADLAGSVEGPEDLATNPVHLAGFGR